MPKIPDVDARPFVKWAGGKRSLLPRLVEHEYVPAHFGTYYEPFVGGGALFFSLYNRGRIRRAHLNDANARLMTTYAAVRDDVEAVVRRLRRKRNDEACYLRERARPRTEDPATVAAWMIYVNHVCFNGLYRVNKSGDFNVPFGHYANPTICDADNLRRAAAALADASITSLDFEAALSIRPRPVAGDFVYFDPPYLTRTGAEFTAYTSDGFGLGDHQRLRDLALALKREGVHVLISNSDTDESRRLYRTGFQIREVMGQRSVGGHAARKGRVGDLLVW